MPGHAGKAFPELSGLFPFLSSFNGIPTMSDVDKSVRAIIKHRVEGSCTTGVNDMVDKVSMAVDEEVVVDERWLMLKR